MSIIHSTVSDELIRLHARVVELENITEGLLALSKNTMELETDMSDKIIDEVMELVTSLWDSGNTRESWDVQCAKYEAIRTKLSEVLERKPISKEKFERMESAAYAATRGKGKTPFEYAENLKNRIEKYHHIGAE